MDHQVARRLTGTSMIADSDPPRRPRAGASERDPVTRLLVARSRPLLIHLREQPLSVTAKMPIAGL
jgi:hypothetical protein